MYSYIKRFFDFFLSLILIVIFLPMMILIFFVILAETREFPLFFQKRPGYKNKIFSLVKFKTMINDASIVDDHRITFVGKFLRSTSIDELPELFNILIGQMSFIGPRPLLIEYLDLYNSEQKRRQLVKPGLTGLAQVNGRNSINWETKFKLDCRYVDEMSFALDCEILFKTFQILLKRSDIDHAGKIMPKFTGNKKK